MQQLTETLEILKGQNWQLLGDFGSDLQKTSSEFGLLSGLGELPFPVQPYQGVLCAGS
jgi:hypothetical protein